MPPGPARQRQPDLSGASTFGSTSSGRPTSRHAPAHHHRAPAATAPRQSTQPSSSRTPAEPATITDAGVPDSPASNATGLRCTSRSARAWRRHPPRKMSTLAATRCASATPGSTSAAAAPRPGTSARPPCCSELARNAGLRTTARCAHLHRLVHRGGAELTQRLLEASTRRELMYRRHTPSLPSELTRAAVTAPQSSRNSERDGQATPPAEHPLRRVHWATRARTSWHPPASAGRTPPNTPVKSRG